MLFGWTTAAAVEQRSHGRGAEEEQSSDIEFYMALLCERTATAFCSTNERTNPLIRSFARPSIRFVPTEFWAHSTDAHRQPSFASSLPYWSVNCRFIPGSNWTGWSASSNATSHHSVLFSLLFRVGLLSSIDYHLPLQIILWIVFAWKSNRRRSQLIYFILAIYPKWVSSSCCINCPCSYLRLIYNNRGVLTRLLCLFRKICCLRLFVCRRPLEKGCYDALSSAFFQFYPLKCP